MNGKRGIAGGYQCAANRRVVHLLDEDSQIAVKPKNIRLMAEERTQKEDHVDNESALQKQRALCNIQCRIGAVSLHEAILSSRLDVAQFLIKLGADIDIADCDGNSPRYMAMDCIAEMASPVVSYIKEIATKQGRKDIRAEKRKCAHCRKSEVNFKICGKCKQICYCSRECQGKCSLHAFTWGNS